MRDRRPFEGLQQSRTLAAWRRENQAQAKAFRDTKAAEERADREADLAEDKRLDDEADRREENAS